MRFKKLFSAGKPAFVVFIALLLASAIVPTQSQARKFKVLHTFHGPDGANPFDVLTRDAAGNLYGTTQAGGSGKGVCVSFGGCGTAFKLNRNGEQVWLHDFTFANGMQPMAGLLRDAAGNLYGTTTLGGDTKCYEYGCGTVFRLDASGHETVLHKFTGDPNENGSDPGSLLAADAQGNLYGTTPVGPGTVFTIGTTGKETVLYFFPGGCVPGPGVILDGAGNLYGAATGCDSGYGEVFELQTDGTLTVLHAFDGGDGAQPVSALVFDLAGNLYGTTAAGGSSQACGGGCGTVFELSPNGGGWTESVLYSFCSLKGCADGEEPLAGPLVRDSLGNLYGTTYFGGNSACGRSGCGTVFKLDNSGHETVLYSFAGGKDGAYPWGGVVMDKAHNLYGAASQAGDFACPANGGSGCGVVFKLTSLTVIRGLRL
jgi:uncharacterized repeat protein (TIGR03803 family)